PFTFTAWPLTLVGVNLACLAAVTAADCSSGCPDTLRAAITFPYSSIVISTVSVPDAFAAFAMAGYSGGGRVMAFPFRTPPEMPSIGPFGPIPEGPEVPGGP